MTNASFHYAKVLDGTVISHWYLDPKSLLSGYNRNTGEFIRAFPDTLKDMFMGSDAIDYNYERINNHQTIVATLEGYKPEPVMYYRKILWKRNIFNSNEVFVWVKRDWLANPSDEINVSNNFKINEEGESSFNFKLLNYGITKYLEENDISWSGYLES
jgi:hypothetical protein